jgi:P-type Ca2+ transporter type 2C
MAAVTGTDPQASTTAWHGLAVDDVVAHLDTDLECGLTSAVAAERLQTYGPNVLQKEAKASIGAIALAQVRDPMNIMLIAVSIVSLFISEWSTAILVAVLVLVNVVMGTQQELKARASVEALAEMQIPTARVVRDGTLASVDATDVVPGDLVSVESGDIIVADGRIVRATNLETQEAALTGESAPIAKDANTVAANAALGDRTDMGFQNTSVTRGTANLVVTATGMQTEVGKIAGLLQSVKRTRSPLQQQLDGLTKWLGVVAWTALAIVVIAGLFRDLDFGELMLLGTAMAISAIPTGMPTFVQGMLSYGARKLADSRAIVRNLNDVETLGATSAINTDKTGTLTLNQMTATKLYFGGEWFSIEGGGYSKQGQILGVAGQNMPDFTPLALALVLASDGGVTDDEQPIGDPTEVALVVLAAKVGVDADITRREYPRIAEVPFDSDYKFMATFHHRKPSEGGEEIVELVKGAPDVVLDRCTHALWKGENVDMATVRDEILASNRELSEKGLRVLGLAFRRMPTSQESAIQADPMGQVNDLVFAALVGIIDPLRSEAKAAVNDALAAGIDVRMITGDHAITAKAIADQLGLGPGVITGPEFAALPDTEVVERLPQLHVFGRVSPEDKLRLATLMQDQGLVVAMTGDAVNDAAALKKADIGVAMGSGSEVSKQAAKMVLTDDNFATLVHAVALGRDIYHKITSYIRYQMSQLFGLVSLFLIAAVFGINEGVALQPMQAIFINFFIAIGPVIAIMTDITDPTVMQDKPRDPKIAIFNRSTGPRWIFYGLVLGVMSMIPLVWGPDEPSIDFATASMTMAFAVMAGSTILSGVVMRHGTKPFWDPVPPFRYLRPLMTGVLILVLATELQFMQQWLLTQPLTGPQWAAVLGLSLVMPIVVEVDKFIQRARSH